MTTAPTPEEFLSMVEPDEPDEGPSSPGDPLVSMAESLSVIAGSFRVSADLSKEASDTRFKLGEYQRECADLEALQQAQAELIAQVLEIIKPSTSKLADTVRATITSFLTGEPEQGTVPEEPDAPPGVPADDRPADDADVEEWRAYARGRGFTGADVDKANRSQIRSMLGVPHPEAAS